MPHWDRAIRPMSWGDASRAVLSVIAWTVCRVTLPVFRSVRCRRIFTAWTTCGIAASAHTLPWALWRGVLTSEENEEESSAIAEHE